MRNQPLQHFQTRLPRPQKMHITKHFQTQRLTLILYRSKREKLKQYYYMELNIIHARDPSAGRVEKRPSARSVVKPRPSEQPNARCALEILRVCTVERSEQYYRQSIASMMRKTSTSVCRVNAAAIQYGTVSAKHGISEIIVFKTLYRSTLCSTRCTG